MIYSLETDPLPEGWIPLDALCVLRGLDCDGDETLIVRTTETLARMPWVAHGMWSFMGTILDEFGFYPHVGGGWIEHEEDIPDDDDDDDDEDDDDGGDDWPVPIPRHPGGMSGSVQRDLPTE